MINKWLESKAKAEEIKQKYRVRLLNAVESMIDDIFYDQWREGLSQPSPSVPDYDTLLADTDATLAEIEKLLAEL